MASDNETSCASDPNFAVICSFLEKFAKSCGITHPNMLDLQEMLENTQEVPQPLVDLHVKLLRKARKSVSGERWEKAIIKFCHSYSNQDGWEIERFGYKKARIGVKLRILKMLLELQFDLNAKFKTEVNRLSADELRCQPLGRDKMGQTYWCQLDEDCNLRVYREDLDDETWEVVAQDRDGLIQLISQLSSNDPFRKDAEELLNEDSNSLEIEKPITDTGQGEAIVSPEDDDEEFEEIDDDDDDSDDMEEDNIQDSRNTADSVNTEKDTCTTVEKDVSSGKNESDMAKKEVSKKMTLEAMNKEEFEAEPEKEAEAMIEPEVKAKKEPEAETKKEEEAEAKKEDDDVTKKESDVNKKESEDVIKGELEAKFKMKAEAAIEKEREVVAEKETEAATKKEPKAETKKEPEAETKKEPKAVTKKEPEAETKKEPETVTKKELEAVTKKEPEVVAKKKSETAAEKAPETAAEKEPEAVSQSKKEVDTKKESEPVTKEVPEAEFRKEQQPEFKTELETECKKELEAQSTKEQVVSFPLAMTLETCKVKDKPDSESSRDEICKTDKHIPALVRKEPVQESILQSELVGMDLSKPSKPRDPEPSLSSNFGIDLSSKTYAERLLQSLDKIEAMNESSTSSSSLVAEDLSDSSKRLQQATDTYEHNRFAVLPLTATDLSTKRPATADLLQASKITIMGTMPEFSSLPVNRINLSGKRIHDSDLMTNEAKKLRLEHTVAANCHKLLPSMALPLSHYGGESFDSEDSTEVGEAIEEPLMLVRGEGSGADCDTGNPGKDGDNGKSNCDSTQKEQIPDDEGTAKSETHSVSEGDGNVPVTKDEGSEGRSETSIELDKSSSTSISDISKTKSGNICEIVNTSKVEQPDQKKAEMGHQKQVTVSPASKQLSPKESQKKMLLDTKAQANVQNMEGIQGSKYHSPSSSSSESTKTSHSESMETSLPIAANTPHLGKDTLKEGELLPQSPPKNIPKLWTIETICAPDEKAKDLQKLGPTIGKTGSSYLGVVSDSLYGEKYNAKLQDTEIAGRIPSGSSSPTKRPSRWDVERADKPLKKGENESNSKASILQSEPSGAVRTSEQRTDEAVIRNCGPVEADSKVASDLLAASTETADAARTSRSNIVIEPRVQIAGAASHTSADTATPEKCAEVRGQRAQASSQEEKPLEKDGSGDAKNNAGKLPAQGFFFGPGCLMKSPIKKTESIGSTASGDLEKDIAGNPEDAVKQEGSSGSCDSETFLASRNTAGTTTKDKIVQKQESPSVNPANSATPTLQIASHPLAKNESPPKVNTSHSIDTIMMSPHKPKDANNFPHPFQPVAPLPFPGETSPADLGKHLSEKYTVQKQGVSEAQVGPVSEEKEKHFVSSDLVTKLSETLADSQKEQFESLLFGKVEEKEQTKSLACSVVSESQASIVKDKDSFHGAKESNTNVALFRSELKLLAEEAKSGASKTVELCQTSDSFCEKLAKNDTCGLKRNHNESTVDPITEGSSRSNNLNTLDGKIEDSNVEKGLDQCVSKDGEMKEKETAVLPTSVSPDICTSATEFCDRIANLDKSVSVHTSTVNKEHVSNVTNVEKNSPKQLQDEAFCVSESVSITNKEFSDVNLTTKQEEQNPKRKKEIKSDVPCPLLPSCKPSNIAVAETAIVNKSASKLPEVAVQPTTKLRSVTIFPKKDEAILDLKTEKNADVLLTNKSVLGESIETKPLEINPKNKENATETLKSPQQLRTIAIARTLDTKRFSSSDPKQLEAKLSDKDLKSDSCVSKMDVKSGGKYEISEVQAVDSPSERISVPKIDACFDKVEKKDEGRVAVASEKCQDDNMKNIGKESTQIPSSQGENSVGAVSDEKRNSKEKPEITHNISVSKSGDNSVSIPDNEKNKFISVDESCIPEVQTACLKNVSVPVPDIEVKSLRALEAKKELVDKIKEKPEAKSVSDFPNQKEGKILISPADKHVPNVSIAHESKSEIKSDISGNKKEQRTIEKDRSVFSRSSLADSKTKSENTSISAINIEASRDKTNDKANVSCDIVGKVSDTNKSCIDYTDTKNDAQSSKTDTEFDEKASASDTKSEAGAKILNLSHSISKDTDKPKSLRRPQDKIGIKLPNILLDKIEMKSKVISGKKEETKTVGVPCKQNEAGSISSSSDKSPIMSESNKNAAQPLHLSRDEVESKSVSIAANKSGSKVVSVSENTRQVKPVSIPKDNLEKESDFVSTNKMKSSPQAPTRKEETSALTDAVEFSMPNPTHLPICEPVKEPVIDSIDKTENKARKKSIVEPANIVAGKDESKYISTVDVKSNIFLETKDGKSFCASVSETKYVSGSPKEVAPADSARSTSNLADPIASDLIKTAESKIETKTVSDGNVTSEAAGDRFVAKSLSLSASKLETKSEKGADTVIERKPATILSDKAKAKSVCSLPDQIKGNSSNITASVVDTTNGSVKSVHSVPVSKTEKVQFCVSPEESKNKHNTISESSVQSRPSESLGSNTAISANAPVKEFEIQLRMTKAVDETKQSLSGKIEVKFPTLSADETLMEQSSHCKDEAKIKPQTVSVTSQKTSEGKSPREVQQSSTSSPDKGTAHLHGQPKNLKPMVVSDTGDNITEKQSTRQLNLSKVVVNENLPSTDKKIDIESSLAKESNISSTTDKSEITIQQEKQKVSADKNVVEEASKATEQKQSGLSALSTKLAHKSSEKSQDMKQKFTSSNFSIDTDGLTGGVGSMNLGVKAQIAEKLAQKTDITDSNVIKDRCDKNSELCSERTKDNVCQDEISVKCSSSSSDESPLTETSTHTGSQETHVLKGNNSKICTYGTDNVAAVETGSSLTSGSCQTRQINEPALPLSLSAHTAHVDDKLHGFQVPSKEPLKITSAPKSLVGKTPKAISSKVKGDSQNKGRRKSLESISMGIMMGKLAAKSSLQEPVSSGSVSVCEQAPSDPGKSSSQSQVMLTMANVISSQENEKGPEKLECSKTEPYLESNQTFSLKYENEPSNSKTPPIQSVTDISKNHKTSTSNISTEIENKGKKDTETEAIKSLKLVVEATKNVQPVFTSGSKDILGEKGTLSTSLKATAASDTNSSQESAELPGVAEVADAAEMSEAQSLVQKEVKGRVPTGQDIPLLAEDTTRHSTVDKIVDEISNVPEKQKIMTMKSGENKDQDQNTENKDDLNDNILISEKDIKTVTSEQSEDQNTENKKDVKVDSCVSEEKDTNTIKNYENGDQNTENKERVNDNFDVSSKQEIETTGSGEVKDKNIEKIESVNDNSSVFKKKEIEITKTDETDDQNVESKTSLSDTTLPDKEDSEDEKQPCNNKESVPNLSEKEKICSIGSSNEATSTIESVIDDHKLKLDVKEDSLPSEKGTHTESSISDAPLKDETQNYSEVSEKLSERDTPISSIDFKLEERKSIKSDTEDLSGTGLDNSQDIQEQSSDDEVGNDEIHHIPDDDSPVEEVSDEPKAASPRSRKRGRVQVQVTGRKRSRVDDSAIHEETGGGSSSEGEEQAAEPEGSSDEGESEAGAVGRRGGSATRTPHKGHRGRRRGRGRGVRGRSRTQRSAAGKSTSPTPTAASEESKREEEEEEESTTPVTTPSKPKSNRGKRAPKLMGLDLGVDIVLEESRGEDEGRPGAPPVRQSRRIAQMKIREEAERRKLEEMTLQQLKDEQSRRRADARAEKKESKGEGKKRKKKLVESDEDFTTEDVDEELSSKKKLKKKKKRRKKKPALSFNESNPWQSSSGSSTSQEDEEEEVEQTEEEEEDDEELIFKSDHEFSPESDLENDATEITPTRRARTAQKGQPCADDEEQPADEHACQKCGKSDHPEWILLCDKCDSGWHGSCLRPALMVIPEGDWFCPPCEHTFLLDNLHSNLLEFDRNWKRRENEELRRKRLAYVGISLDNVLPNKDKESGSGGESAAETKKEAIASTSSDSSDSESRSSSDNDSEPVYQLRQRRQTLFSYRFNEYDDLINSAIQDEMEAVKGAGNQGRGKDIATIVKAEAEAEELQALQKSEEVQEKSEEVQEKSKEVQEKSEEVPEKLEEKEEKVEPVCDAGEQEEMPCVVPKHEVKDDEDDEDEFCPFKKFQIKKKHRRLNSLDISSEDDAESDEDFKGTSSDDDEEEYEGSEGESEDSEFGGRRGKGSRRRASGPVRRSSRARITRFDKEFINDDSEDSEPLKKKSRRMWDDSDSEDSDASWRRSKRAKKQVTVYKVKNKKKKKKRSKREVDSDLEVYKAKKPKIKFGGLEEDEVSPTRRTRGRKINYQELGASDSEEETWGRARKLDSEDEYVVNEEEDEEEEDEPLPDLEKDSENESGELIVSKKHNKTKPERKGKSKKTAKGRPDKTPRKGRKFVKAKRAIIDSDEEGITPVGDAPVLNVHEDAADGAIHENIVQVPDAEMIPVTAPALPLADLPKERRGRTRGQGKKQEEQKKKGRRKKKAEIAAENATEGIVTRMQRGKGNPALLGQQVADVQLLPAQSRNAAELSAKSGESLIQRLGSGRGVTITLKSNSELLPDTDRAMLLQSGKGAMETDPLRSLLAAPPVIPPDGELKVNEDVPPPAGKRKGRGRGKAAADSSKASDVGHYPSLQGFPGQSGAGIGNANNSSVITRMLQAQPVSGAPQSFTAAAAAMGHKYFGSSAGDSSMMPMQNAGRGTSSVPPYTGSPKGLPSPYRQPPPTDSGNPNLGPGMGHYGSSPSTRGTGIRGPPPGFPQTNSMRLRNPPPNSQPHMFHTSHHPMDPSPSGGGPIIISSGAGPPPPPAGSPLTSKPGTPSTSHSTPTPPPPPYSRASSQMPLAPPSSTTMSSIVQFPLQPGDASQAPARHPPAPFPPASSTAQQSPPPPHQGRSPVPGNFSPYHPPPAANYHYGGYPPPPPMSAADDALPPSAFQGSPYTDHYTSSDMTANLQASDGSNSKSYDEEGGGEFGGLVSYFSSQREDDLDT